MPRWSDWQPIRHQVAIGGVVTDAAGMRVAQAVVTVDAPGAPQPSRRAAARRGARAADAPAEPVDRAESRADGSFFFLDLPDGTYTVKATHARLTTAEQKAVVARDKTGKVAMASVVLRLVNE